MTTPQPSPLPPATAGPPPSPPARHDDLAPTEWDALEAAMRAATSAPPRATPPSPPDPRRVAFARALPVDSPPSSSPTATATGRRSRRLAPPEPVGDILARAARLGGLPIVRRAPEPEPCPACLLRNRTPYVPLPDAEAAAHAGDEDVVNGARYCACAWGQLRLAEARRERDQVRRQVIADRLAHLTTHLLDWGPRYRDARLGPTSWLRDTEAYANVEAFVRDWDYRRNLVLTGEHGVGKTALMVGVAKALAPRLILFEGARWQVLWTTPTDLLDRLKRGFDDGSYEVYLQRCCDVGLLVLDDLGTENDTAWALEKFFQILNDRYKRQLPVFLTTNLDLEQLAARLGERVVYRLLEDGLAVHVEGPNLREPTVRAEMQRRAQRRMLAQSVPGEVATP